MNPILHKEMILNARSKRYILSCIVINILLFIITVFRIITISDSMQRQVPNYNDFTKTYIALTIIQLIFIMITVPITTGATISVEIENKTLPMLKLTKLTPMNIVMGKLCAIIIVNIVILTSSLPILILSLVFGGLSIINVLEMYLFTIFFSIYLGSIGIFCSSVFKKTVNSIIASISIVIIISVISFLIAALYFSRHRYLDIGSANLDLNISPLVYSFLINPVMSYIMLIFSIIGVNNPASSIFINLGLADKGNYIINNFMWISYLIQSCISILLISIAIFRVGKDNK